MMEKVNILLVDDQPAKLLAYEVILKELGENLVCRGLRAGSAGILLKNEVAVILVERLHARTGRFRACRHDPPASPVSETAMIFISAIQVSDIDRLPRLRDGRGRLCAGTGDPGSPAR